MTNGWKAHVVDDFMHGRKRLILFRDVGDRTEVNNPDGTWTSHEISTVPVDPPGYLLPPGAWEAIEELILPKAKDGEIALLKEALQVERNRTDGVLNRLLPKESS